MDELGPHERRLLDALQEDDSPTLMDSDRIKERVLLSVSVAAAAGLVTATGLSTATGASMAAAAPGAAATTTAAATTAAATGSAAATGTAALTGTAIAGTAATGTAKAALGAGLWKALVVVGATAGLGGGAYLATSGNVTPTSSHQSEEGAAEERATGRVPGNDSSAVNEPTDTNTLTTLDAGQEEAVRAEAAPSASVPQTLKKADGSTATDLKQEAALLQKAQAALQNGNPQGALTALAEHKAKYPRGVLAGEREAALSVAYCNAGDLARGRARAQVFIKRNPASPMVQRLQAACKLPSE